MELRLLKVFCAVAGSNSLVAAAGKLRLTPSAISHSLKSLETELGCRLFERVGKRMVLNHAGEQLFAQIQEPLTALDTAAEGIKHLGKWGQTRLRIAASSAACEHLLPGVIRELKKAHPSIELRVESGDTPHAIDCLQQNKVDIALGLMPAKAAGLAARPVFRDELMFVFASSHPWASARSISCDEIRSQQFIICQRSSLTAWLLDDYFRRLKITPNVTMEVASTPAIIELVKSNLGVSILAPWTVNGELLRGELKMRPLAPKPVWRNWSIISLAARKLSLAEETFCRLCRNRAAAMRLDRSDLPPEGRTV
jgi:LysR family transcriptional regulator, low CO2-responsive transcriptional regulator